MKIYYKKNQLINKINKKKYMKMVQPDRYIEKSWSDVEYSQTFDFVQVIFS